MILSALAAVSLAFASPVQDEPESPEMLAEYAAMYRQAARALAVAPLPVIVSVETDPRAHRMHVTGTAPAIWFNENQMSVWAEDAAGEHIGGFLAHAPHAYGDEESESWAFEVEFEIAPGDVPATIGVAPDDGAGEWGPVGPPPNPEFRFSLPPSASMP